MICQNITSLTFQCHYSELGSAFGQRNTGYGCALSDVSVTADSTGAVDATTSIA